MRERVAVFGGEFGAGPRDRGGFAVRALPVERPHVTSVVVADDQALVRGGFRLILEGQDDSTSSARPRTGAAAVERARELRPDVVVDGRAHAGARRHRGDPRIVARGPSDPCARADDLRRGPDRLRRAQGGGGRLPAQERPAGAARRSGAARGRRRGLARPDRDAPADRGFRPPPAAGRDVSGAAGRVDRPRAGGAAP